ncbi:MAG TPA: group II intron reverse transcriptase/maturase [Clostridiales bacterium]|nr:group II intron reverse transcriptase/maturase [Clostridiales bacterium]
MDKTKPYNISKQVVKFAFDRVKANKGTYGIDEQSITDFEENLKDNLYKIWNRMSSGTYFPKPVKAVAIPKKNGGTRILGIPTVEDRVAQMVAKMYFEPNVEKLFYQDSYGYRPNKSAIDAVGVLRERCWKKDWVVDFDIKGLFDNIRHDYLIEMVKRHTNEQWIILYVERWLKTPFKMQDGTIVDRTAGTPQGGVISPVLANLFLHYVFDDFMSKEFPNIQWVRYADDGALNCVSLKQAKYIIKVLDKRFKKFGLELNLAKTRIVYCKDGDRKGNYENTSFDFLGFTFRGRQVRDKEGRNFSGFLPAISNKAQKDIRRTVRDMRLQGKVSISLKDIARILNSKIQGWINYYGRYYKSGMYKTLRYINRCIVKWVKKKYKMRTIGRAMKWLYNVAKKNSEMFAHWKIGIISMA